MARIEAGAVAAGALMIAWLGSAARGEEAVPARPDPSVRGRLEGLNAPLPPQFEFRKSGVNSGQTLRKAVEALKGRYPELADREFRSMKDVTGAYDEMARRRAVAELDPTSKAGLPPGATWAQIHAARSEARERAQREEYTKACRGGDEVACGRLRLRALIEELNERDGARLPPDSSIQEVNDYLERKKKLEEGSRATPRTDASFVPSGPAGEAPRQAGLEL